MPETEPILEPIIDFSNTEIAFSDYSDKELIKMKRLFGFMNKSKLVNLSTTLGMWAVKYRIPLSTFLIKNTIFNQFCGGQSLAQSQASIDRLANMGVASVLDYGAESKTEESDLDYTLKELIKAVEFAGSNSSVPVISTKITALAEDDILTKAQTDQALNKEEQISLDKAKARLDVLCKRASELGVKVFVDAEESWMQDTIDEMVVEMMMKYNKEHVIVYNTFQMYRVDKLAHIKDSYQHALENGYKLGAKLVRGAYMNKERQRANERGYPCLIHADKKSTDRDYDKAIKFCVDHYDTMASCNASHNLNSNLYQANLIHEKGIVRDHPNLNFCQLYGMSDNITFNLASKGFNVAKYVVYGPIRDVLPYLVRRAQENTSVTDEMSREYQLIYDEVKRRKLA